MVCVVLHLVALSGEVLLVPHLQATQRYAILCGNVTLHLPYLFFQDDVHPIVLVLQVAESAEQRLPLLRLVVTETLRIFQLHVMG